ncbi:response regulator transcription factor [Ideonella azotifigens]|uniref:Response regulator transcription factor n=1 Tax=Ideonella azotifigens TaxID=513160 RepID=A0ABP3V5X7_9BURK|nr:response regulator transcription factor [Ideonella azotifigens]MCD2341398.1 response regulator transcription factor [Ideonella azotifigens]
MSYERMSHEAGTVRVSVIHSEAVIALGIATALRGQSSCEVDIVGATASPLAACVSARADVAVCDPTSAALLLAQRREHAHGWGNSVRVLVVSTQVQPQDVQAALRHGAHGYALLDCGISQLQEIVLAVSRGQRHLCPAAASLVAESMSYQALTGRESEVLQLLAQGDSNKSIANALSLSGGTVKAHVKSILNKLDAKSRTEAANVAMRRGLIGSQAPSSPATGVRTEPSPAHRPQPAASATRSLSHAI